MDPDAFEHWHHRLRARVHLPVHVGGHLAVDHVVALQVVAGVEAVTEHVLVDGRDDVELLVEADVEGRHGLERLVEVAHAVGSKEQASPDLTEDRGLLV